MASILSSESSGHIQNSSTEMLEKKISVIETSIQDAASRRETFHQNALSVKSSIQEWVGLQLGNLRQREVQLLRQVDAFVVHQNSLLQVHLTKLYHALGSMRAMKLWLEQGKPKYPIDLKSNNEYLQNIPLPTLRFHVENEESLQSAIHSFGCVAVDGGLAAMFSLPEEEDYGDGDHHVLYKTLNEEEPTRVCINFPTLSKRRDDWLLGSVSKVNELQSSLDVEVHNKHFLLPDCPSVASTTDSIELIPSCDPLWLERTYKEQDEKKDMLDCNFCHSTNNVEIENLASLSCVPNILSQGLPSPVQKKHSSSEWSIISNESTSESYIAKSPGVATLNENTLLVPPVQNACKANEMCKAYNECLYEESCIVTSLKEQLKKMKMDESTAQQFKINQAINKAIQSQTLSHDGLEKWLTSNKQVKSLKKAPGLQAWLATNNEKFSAYRRKPKIILPDIFSQPDTNIWLLGKGITNSRNSNENKVMRENNLTDNCWLLQFQNKISVNDTEVKQMFKPYFQPLDAFKWLKSSQSEKRS